MGEKYVKHCKYIRTLASSLREFEPFVIQMLFKPFGICFHVAGTKTDLDSLS